MSQKDIVTLGGAVFRLNVVRRPIKREDACRPVVLSDGRTAFRCIYCKKDFCTISDVNRHMDFHEGELIKIVQSH